MDTRAPDTPWLELPDLITVEEACEILHVGRTKGYAMAKQWRTSGGAAGLPVLDFGNVLRVPTHALEQMVGAKLQVPPGFRCTPPTRRSENPAPSTTSAPATHRPKRRSRSRTVDQLDLFEPLSET